MVPPCARTTSAIAERCFARTVASSRGESSSARVENPRMSEKRIVASTSSWSCMPSSTPPIDRKSTRLNSSHDQISYAVFCLKKKNRRVVCVLDGRFGRRSWDGQYRFSTPVGLVLAGLYGHYVKTPVARQTSELTWHGAAYR